MESKDLGFPAGWYDDPSGNGGRRYFDGERWTDHFEPPPDPQRQQQGETKEREATGTIIAGYIFAFVMPIVGFVIGLTQINRNRHGLWVVLASVGGFILWLIIIGSLETNGGSGSYGGY